MQISRRGLLAAGAAGAAAVAVQGLPSASAAAHTSARYRWRNAEMVGGGFVPGIVFNQAEPGLVYARTDIGGAYRWDHAAAAAGSRCWTGSAGRTGVTPGVASLATDAQDPDQRLRRRRDVHQ